MRIQRKIIEYDEIEAAFMELEEDLEKDIAEVRASLIHDTHFGSLDLQIEIGSDDIDQFGAVSELYLDLDEISTKEKLLEVGLEKSAVLTFFDASLLAVLIEKQIFLSWNVNDHSTTDSVNLIAPGEGYLRAMDQ